MKLFVANCSRQFQIFNYRLPEVPSPKAQGIEIGSQVRIGGEFAKPELDAVLKTLLMYGAKEQKVAADSEEVVPLVYSVDAPVRLLTIQKVIENNGDSLLRRGARFRKAAAIATSNQLAENVGGLQNFESSIEEEKQGDFRDRDPFAEGLRVAADSGPAQGPKPRAPRTRKAA